MPNIDLHFFCSQCSKKNFYELTHFDCELKHKIMTFKKGDYIVFQGDNVTSLHMLTKGKVKAEIVSPAGFVLFVEEMKAPYPLGADFLFADSNSYPVNVIAEEYTEILLIDKTTIETQMGLCPNFLRGFIAFSANRTQMFAERLKVFSQRGLKGKLSYYILQRDKQGTFNLDKSITSLAEYFGTDRPSLSRVISEMTREGIIEYETGTGRILDYSKLKNLLG